MKSVWSRALAGEADRGECLCRCRRVSLWGMVQTPAGGMAEWTKATVLKTVVRRKVDRGFESLSLRQRTSGKARLPGEMATVILTLPRRPSERWLSG